MKILARFISLVLFTTVSFAAKSKKEEPIVVYPVLEVKKDISAQKIFDKVENIIFEEFKLENVSIKDVVRYLTEKSSHHDKKYKEGVNVILDLGTRPEEEGDIKRVTFSEDAPITLAKLFDKVCKEFSLKWKVGKYAVVIAPQMCPCTRFNASYSVTPTFIKIVLNLPYLKTNKTKFRKVRLSEKNLKKGFARLGIVLNEPCVLKGKYDSCVPQVNGDVVSYDPKTKMLTIGCERRKDFKCIEKLISSYKEQRGGWKPFYDCLKEEDDRIKLQERLNKIVIDRLVFNKTGVVDAFNQLSEVVGKIDAGITVKPQFEDQEIEDGSATITASFRKMSVKDTIQYMCNAANLRYRFKNDSFIIKREFELE